MSFSAALAQELKDNANVATLVGTKVYQRTANPSVSLPYIVIVMYGGIGHSPHMTGASTLAELRGDIECHDTTQILAERISRAVRQQINSFRAANGTMGSGGATTNCRRLTMLGPVDGDVGPTDGSAQKKYVSAVPFSAWVQET